MKKRNLGLEIGLIVLLIIIFIVPIFIFINNGNNNKKYESLVTDVTNAAKKYITNKTIELGSSLKISLEELKKTSLLDIHIVNPKTKRPLANASYILVSNNNGKYNYDIKLYDIPKNENHAGFIINFNGEKTMQNGISVRYQELGINVLSGSNKVEYATQYFLKGKEVTNIDSSRPRNYEVIYTAIDDKGELAKVTRKVIIQ